jgi:hypothetical protein
MQYILVSLSYSLYLPLFLFLRAYPGDIQLFQAFNGVSDDLDALVDLLESIEHFMRRLDIYSKVPPTPAMTEIVIRIMVELLSTLALATKQIRQGRPSESVFADVLPTSSLLCREICEEAFRRERHGGGSSEAGPTHPG